MNAEMKNGINLLMILVLFISCVQEKEDNNVLRRVEACMELFPDSALSLLSQIECPECMRGQQRADYALLLTQALDKNYLDNLQSDSLIMIAVEYYKQEGDKLKAGKAYFYYGKVMLLRSASQMLCRLIWKHRVSWKKLGIIKYKGWSGNI